MELEKHITDERTGISYTLCGDYYLPDLKLPEEKSYDRGREIRMPQLTDFSTVKMGGLAAARFFAKNSSGVVRRIAEQQRDAPQTRDAHQGIDNAADGSQLAAADKGHAVKGEQPHAAPVQRTDDDQDQSNAIHNLHDGFPPFPKKYADK